ncbi:MAG: flagellar protein FlgN [Acetivibrionales bacterium]|jgi:translation initiation factor 2 alpha subunit (eIF-2alpha)|nr:flagellar protein FlgN [Clostridiaceae bacterium]
MPDKNLADNLITTLRYEYKTYLEIFKIAERKTDLLVKNDAESLVPLSEQESKMAEQTFKLNQVREQIIKTISERLGQDYKTMTLEKLKKLLKEPYKKQLNEIHSEMSDLLAKLSARNEVNKKLIENAIKYLDFNIQLLTGPNPATSTYGKSGLEVTSADKRSMFDLKY